MANLLALTAVALDTNMKCSWTLVGSAFSSVTSMVLTYTDLDTVEWINVPVAVTGTGAYEEIVGGLTPEREYKVYLTVFGKDGSNANLLKLSEVKYVKALAPPALPEITILSGVDYLQLLFKDAVGAPYNFYGKGILGFVVSCNDLSADASANNANVGGPSAKDFLVSQVKEYSFTALEGGAHMYNYVIMPDLASSSDYEVAITYYDEFGIRPIQNITTPEAPANTKSIESPTFTAYALNDPVNPFTTVTTPKIIVEWRNPLVKILDDLADLPQRPLKIVREKKVGTNSENQPIYEEDASFNLSQSVDLATNFTDNGYSRLSAGKFAYTDSDNLVAGTQYRYVVTMKELNGTTETDSTTPPVVALITPTVELPAETLILDVSDGSIQLDASFSEIVTNDGGFAQSDFANTDFKLAYKLGTDTTWSYKAITIANDRVTTADIARRVAGQESVVFKIMATPKHTTDYASYTDDTDSQDITSSRESAELGDNYNTVLPGEVADFEYTNATATATAEASFTLTWSATDSKTNDNSDPFYRVVATNDPNHFTAIFSEAVVSRKPAHDFADVITAVDGTLSYTFDATTNAFFTKGQDYSFTIQRIYLDNNTISRENTDVAGVGLGEEGYLLGTVAGESHRPLRMFENPPTPVPSAHAFNEETGVLSFTLNHAVDPATHGFINADTRFKITVKDSDGDVFFTEGDVDQTATKVHTVAMSSAVVGGRYTLTVMAQNYAGFLGHDNGPSSGTSFYSAATEELEFVKEGPVGTSTSVISNNSIGGETRGADLLVDWSAVTDAAAAELGAPIYYIMSVQDETATPKPAPVVVYLKSPVAEDADMFIGAAPANLYAFSDANSNTPSYEHTVPTLGHEYSFTIKAQYLSKQFADKYITGGNKKTTNDLLAVGDLPNPAVTMDVEHNTEIGDRVHIMMDLADAINESGLVAADLKFVYVTDKAVMTYLGANVMEATILASAFNSLVKKEKIPISVYTFYRTHSSSEHIEEEDVEFLSSGVINTDQAQFNPVRYTFAPQVKQVTLEYVDSSANIVVTVEANDNVAPIEAVIMTHATDGNVYTLTHDRDAQGQFVSAGTGNDGDYNYSLSVAVGEGSLMLFSFTCNNPKGLGVAKFGHPTGLAEGTYVRDVRASADMNSPFVLQ
jgi:hypothetical protein